MADKCAELINSVLFGKHSKTEWKELQAQFNAIVATASQEEIERIDESGIEEMLSMICSDE